MAKIIATFDTVEKTLSVSVDGKPVDNVVEAMFGSSYMDEDEYACSLRTMVQDEANDTRQFTTLIACESKRGKELNVAKSSAIPSFYEVPSLTKAQEDIIKCIEQSRKG